MIQDSGPKALAAEADSSPLMVVGHAFSAVAVVMCAVAVGLLFFGALWADRSIFLSGGLAMLAGVVLELRAKALIRCALEVSVSKHSADVRVADVVERHI